MNFDMYMRGMPRRLEFAFATCVMMGEDAWAEY